MPHALVYSEGHSINNFEWKIGAQATNVAIFYNDEAVIFSSINVWEYVPSASSMLLTQGLAIHMGNACEVFGRN